MARCEVQVTGAFADLTLTVLVNKDGTQLVNIQAMALKGLSLHKPDPVPMPPLNYAGRKEPETKEVQGGATLDVTFPPVVGSNYKGALTAPLKFNFTLDFWADCTGPYCISGQVKKIQCDLKIEYKLPLVPNYNLWKIHYDFPDVDLNPAGCPTPPWTKCCGPLSHTVDLAWDSDLTSDIEASITGDAVIEYTIWRKIPQEGSEHTSGQYQKTGAHSDGSMRFELREESVRANVPLPASLGGGAIELTQATGHAIARLGPIAGHLQAVQIVELNLCAPSVTFPDGRHSGINRIVLAPGCESSGTLNLDTGAIDLRLAEVIVNDLFDIAAPINVRSRVVGFYDAPTGQVRIVSRAVDNFPNKGRKVRGNDKPARHTAKKTPKKKG
jgi:hypothetical protein